MMLTALCLAVLAQDGGSLSSELDAALGSSEPVVDAGVPPQPSTFQRIIQTLNPDIAAIIDADLGAATAPHYSLSGDDPALMGTSTGQPIGFALQEIELALQATVDPFFRADLYLTVPNLSGIEVEEAVVTTTSLPIGLQVKGGLFRSAFGRQNGQHLHVQDFTRRPLINAAFLGEDGLKDPGVQISWLFPTPFFLQFYGEVFRGGDDFLYATELKAFVPLGDSFSIYGGVNAMFARGDVFTQAVDLYVKWKPPNVVGGYFSLAWQTEYFYRMTPAGSDGGFYTQLVAQVARQWIVGARQDLLGAPSNATHPRVSRTSLSVTFTPSEFARLRAYVERENIPDPTAFFLLGAPTWAGYLQLEVSIGAHGAHPF